MQEYAIGVDIGGTNIRAALISPEGEVVSKVKALTGSSPLTTLRALLAPLCCTDVTGIGVAVAGIIDRDKGVVLRSPNIPELNGVALRDEVRSWFNLPVLIENDANVAALGEAVRGAGSGFRSFVLLTLGTGVGGGVFMDGRLLSAAAEIGHISINAEGQACACGNVGCLESYASATAIIGNAISEMEKGTATILRELYQGNFYKVTAEDIYNAALDGDSLSRTILREAGRSLGIGIANIINIFSPEAVILTGGLIGAWNIYIDSAIREASKRALKELYARTEIIPSALGDDAGIIGAACLVSEQISKKSQATQIAL
ncbi:MAG: ROK family protein [Thermodesulfovibrionales bacterium]